MSCLKQTFHIIFLRAGEKSFDSSECDKHRGWRLAPERKGSTPQPQSSPCGSGFAIAFNTSLPRALLVSV